MKMKITLLLFVFSCSRMTIEQHETQLSKQLDFMVPIAEQIEDIKLNAEKGMKMGLSSDPKIRDKYNSDSSMYSVTSYQKTLSLSIQLRPYMQKYSVMKYGYITKFGEIEYNNFIKSQNLEWGLGLYW